MNTIEACPVFDRNGFGQAMFNKREPAGRGYDHVRGGNDPLPTSLYVVEEVRRLYSTVPNKHGVTSDDCRALVEDFLSLVIFVDQPPVRFIHQINPDDSAYVDRAIAVGAMTIVSRDNHSLGRVNVHKPWSASFRKAFPTLRVGTPVEYLATHAKA